MIAPALQRTRPGLIGFIRVRVLGPREAKKGHVYAEIVAVDHRGKETTGEYFYVREADILMPSQLSVPETQPEKKELVGWD